MAGGKGTRLRGITGGQYPKPMYQIYNKPILQRQLECLKKNNITDICIIVGYLGDTIIDYFKDGKFLGLNISYFKEDFPLGTAGALPFLSSFLKEDNFILVFGDILFDIDFNRFYSFHSDNNSVITMFIHPNNHPYDSDLVTINTKNQVISINSKKSTRDAYYNNLVNAGIYLLSPEAISKSSQPIKMDLEEDIIQKYIPAGKVFGYVSTEYAKDIGTPERLEQAEKDISNGLVSAKNLLKKQECIFLDRDGTINVYNGLVSTMDDFILEKTTSAALKKINQSKYLGIVITNQPAVARGLCTIKDVEKIHQKLETLLGNEGAYLDDILFCPHHPDAGFPQENKEYKIKCECRKPGIKMVLECEKKWNIDLSLSWIIGDTTTDIQTGKNAGLRTILVKTGQAGSDNKYPVLPDYICDNLLEAVELIIHG
jgi:histidinol-phosphate phosphatase family protein